MTIDPKMRETAQEWAGRNVNIDDHPLNSGVKAAAEVLSALPEHIIDADQVREIIEEMQQNLDAPTISEHRAGHDSATADWKKALESLLPAPKPRTLADMTEDERDDCLWMQCDTGGLHGSVIASIGTTRATLIKKTGAIYRRVLGEVTPLPDLPRMVWPASESDVSIISPKIDTSTEHDDSVNTSPDQPIKAVTTRTVIAQAEQIKRLQEGIKKLGSWPGGPMPITLIEDGIITKADME